MLQEKGQLIPIATLENNLILLNLEKSAASQIKRIAPFQNRPLAVLKDVFDDADHFGGGKLCFKHQEI